MVTAGHRASGEWPAAGERLEVEVAARGERLSLGEGAADVTAGGATGVEGAVRLWHPLGLGLGVSGGWFAFDTPPLEEPDVPDTWFVLGRLTARLR